MTFLEGFRMPDVGQQTITPGVLKAVSGSLGALPVRVYKHREYDDLNSALSGVETQREIVMIGIKTDRYTEVAIAEHDLDYKKRAELAPLLDRFYTQRDTHETLVEMWEAISESERVVLGSLGIQSVEQLAATPDGLLSRLGKLGQGLKEKAVRHLAGKAKSDEAQERAEEMRLLREENERLAARMAELEKLAFASHEEKARKGGKAREETSKEVG